MGKQPQQRTSIRILNQTKEMGLVFKETTVLRR